MLIDQAEQMQIGQIVDNSGSITNMEGLNEALFGIIEERYKGAMEIQSTSFNGMISNAMDSMGTLASTLSQPIFETLKDGMQSVIPVLGSLTSFITGDTESARQGLVEAFGEETANKIIGTFETIQVGVNSLKEFLQDLMPVVENLKRIFIGLMPVFGMVGGAIAVVWRILAQVIPPTLEMLTGLAASILEWEGFLPLLAGVVAGFLAFKTTIAVINGVKTAMDIFRGVMLLARNASTLLRLGMLLLNAAFLANPIAWVIGLIVGLVAMFVVLYKRNEDFRNLINKVWSAIKEAFSSVIDWATETLPVWFENIKNWFSDTVESIIQFFSSLKDGILLIIQPFITYFIQSWENLKLLVLGIVQTFIGLLTGDFDKLKLGLEAIWTAIKDQALAWWTLLKDTVIAVVTNLWNGAVDLFKTGKENAVQWIKDLWSNVVKWFTDIKDSAIEKVEEMWDGITDWIGGILEEFIGMGEDIVDTVSDIDLKKVGKDLIRGFIDGIGSMIDSVKTKAKEIAGNVEKAIKDRLESKSPSRVLMRIGVDTGIGFVEGLDKTIDKARNKALSLADSVTNAISNTQGSYNFASTLPLLGNQLQRLGGSMGIFDGIQNTLGTEQHTHYWQLNADEITDVSRLLDIVNSMVQTVRSR